MISFNYETDFELDNEEAFENWIIDIVDSEASAVGEINYVSLNDELIKEDGFVDLYLAESVTVSGMDAYYTTQKLCCWCNRRFTNRERENFS